jgi:hypothetical protein
MFGETVPLTSKNSTLLKACFERHIEWLAPSTSFTQSSFLRGRGRRSRTSAGLSLHAKLCVLGWSEVLIVLQSNMEMGSKE